MENGLIPKKKERVLYLDSLRVYAMILVIILHVVASNWDSVPLTSWDFKFFNIYDSIARPAVSLFVMLSGSFLLDPERAYPKEKLKKKILKILAAYFIWAFFYDMVSVVSNILNGEFQFNKETVIDFSEKMIYGHYHEWFLLMIAGLYLITPLLRQITNSKRMMQYFILLSFLFFYCGNMLKILPHVGKYFEYFLETTRLDFIGGYTCCFVLGYYLRRYDLSSKKRNVIYLFGILSLLFTIIGTYYMSLHRGEATEFFYNNMFPNVVLMAAAWFVLFKYTVKNASQRKKRIVYRISEYSLGMYLVHIFFVKVISKTPLNTLSYPAFISVPVGAVIVFVLSYISVWLIKKIPGLRKYAV